VHIDKTMLADLILFELVKDGGRYEGQTSAPIRGLIERVLPEETVISTVLTAALKSLESEGWIKIHRAEPAEGKANRGRARILEFTGSLDAETLSRLHQTWAKAQSETRLSGAPDMTPNQQGLYSQVLQVNKALRDRLRRAENDESCEMRELRDRVHELEGIIETQRRDLEGRRDPSTAAAEAVVAEAKKEGII
jgi:hypothetical protein